MFSYFSDQYSRVLPNGAGQMFVVLEQPRNSIILAVVQAGLIIGLTFYGIHTYLKIQQSAREEEYEEPKQQKAHAFGDANPIESRSSQSFSYFQESTGPTLKATDPSRPSNLRNSSHYCPSPAHKHSAGHYSAKSQGSSEFLFSKSVLATPQGTKNSATDYTRPTCRHRSHAPFEARVSAGANKAAPPTPARSDWLKTQPQIQRLQQSQQQFGGLRPINSQQRFVLYNYPELATLSARTARPFPSYLRRLPPTPLCHTALQHRARRSESVETAKSFDPEDFEVTGSTQHSTFTFEHRCGCSKKGKFSGTLESFEDFESLHL
ncbi:unnamed protein product [Bursaphelenchus xylophilus]|uniref:(pine wood nematode) hypothetical protein n=1 Tax=Bursaphelenchus xylophilus TaxID=6326 RepID=A0A1I7RK05_BURXY|nr:unnamed protein product [Bursaphelenchus xylophilus]CAG9131599.1 unnamed protein product [Bursaphelenchus xylophilus]